MGQSAQRESSEDRRSRDSSKSRDYDYDRDYEPAPRAYSGSHHSSQMGYTRPQGYTEPQTYQVTPGYDSSFPAQPQGASFNGYGPSPHSLHGSAPSMNSHMQGHSHQHHHARRHEREHTADRPHSHGSFLSSLFGSHQDGSQEWAAKHGHHGHHGHHGRHGHHGHHRQQGGELKHHYFDHVHQPRSHALVLDGVRVLEIGKRTWSSALCGQMLAASGADVVRVAFGAEGEAMRAWGHSKDGDLRNNAVKHEDAAKVLEKARVHPVVPVALHVGKRLAPHRPDHPMELQAIKAELLPGADMLLTDLTVEELEQMGLGYPAIKERFPHIIYVHTASIGVKADLSQKGVEDAGAFYCLTGLAEELGHYLGPRGLAASTAASSLFGVCCLAVMRRRCGCRADRLELSIFRAGKWSATLGVVTDWAQPPRAHDTKHEYSQHEGIEHAPPMPFNVKGAAHVTPHHDTHHHHHDHVFHTSPNFTWRDRTQDLELPMPMEFNPFAHEKALERVSVIEISDEYFISAAAVGRMLVDLGAQVTKVERPSRPDPWRSKCPELFEALNRGKTVDEVEYGGSMGGEAALYRALSSATILLTNLPWRAMDAWGLNVHRLQELFPHLIIVVITTWGMDKKARDHEHRDGRKGGEEVHAFWEASGLSRTFNDAKMPPGLSELSVAQCVLAGIGLALLRQQRTNSGQLCHVSRYHAGFFCRLISESEPPDPGASQLLQTQDGRFLRLLGRGHTPHDVWMLLHAVGKVNKDKLMPKGEKKNNREGFFTMAAHEVTAWFHTVKTHFEGWTWADIQRHQKELLDCAHQWRYDALARKFNEKGIDWFVEELRPGQTEAQHRATAADVERCRLAHAEAERTMKKWAEEEERLVYYWRALPPVEPLPPRRHIHHQQRQEQDNGRDTEGTGDALEAVFEERLSRERAVAGAVQFSLMWNTRDDLNLSCITAGQETISSKSPNSKCGGIFDVEMNEGRKQSQEPVENLSWKNSPPPGNYQVVVENAAYKEIRQPEGIPFTLRLKFPNQEIFFEAECSGEQEQSRVLFSFEWSGPDRNVQVQSPPNSKMVPGSTAAAKSSAGAGGLFGSLWSSTSSGKAKDDKGKEKKKKNKHHHHHHHHQDNQQEEVMTAEERAAQQRHDEQVAHKKQIEDGIEMAKLNQGKARQQMEGTRHQLELAEHALQWLQWRDGLPNNALAPWSVEDKSWVEACGGKMMLRMPVTMSCMNNQVSVGHDKPHHVALFPQLYDAVPKVVVTIKGANNLKYDTRFPDRRPRAYCICEIPGKPQSRFKTRTWKESSSPEWNYTQEIKFFEIGNSLAFSVHALNPEGSLAPGASVQITGLEGRQAFNGQMGTCMEYDARQGVWSVRIGDSQFAVRPENLIAADAAATDDFLGWVSLNSRKFFPSGYDGLLDLHHTGGFKSSLRITIDVKGNYGTILKGEYKVT